MSYHRAVFLDRDGTIIVDQHYPNDPKKVELFPDAIEALKLMSQKGYLLYVISNQSGIGRGIISEDQFQQVHARTKELIEAGGVEIQDYKYCPHHPSDSCYCRKPKDGNVPRSFQGAPIRLRESFMVGDRESDLLLGHNIQATSYLVLTGKGEETLRTITENSFSATYKVEKTLLDVACDLPKIDSETL